MSTHPPLLPDEARYELKLSPTLGAGNFLYHAYAVNPGRDLPLIYSDKPLTTIDQQSLNAVSITQLKDAAEKYSAWYFSCGVAPMEPVAVYCNDGLQYLVQYIALTALGAVPVLTNGAMEPGLAADFFRRVRVVGIMTDRDHRTALEQNFGCHKLKLFENLENIPACDTNVLPTGLPFTHDYESPVMITHSSGTTGIPKPVTLLHGAWFHGIRQLLGLAKAQGSERYLSSLPASHNAAIAFSIHAILNGAAIMIMGNCSGDSVAAAIEQFRPASVVSFPQTFVELSAHNPSDCDFSSVTTWINSGDAAHEAHIRRLVAHGYHYRGEQKIEGSQFVDGLGSSELGHSSFRIVHTPYTNTYDRCIGIPQSWVDATVLQLNGEASPIGTVGRLGVRSPSVTAGYWNDSQLTYSSRLRGYWLTGDLVYRDQLGCYYHVDRESDVIHTSSGPLYSLQTEELILKHYGEQLIDCTVVGTNKNHNGHGTQVGVAFVIPKVNCTVDTTRLLTEINARQVALNRPSVEFVFSVTGADIPLGVTGKVLKRVLRERLVSELADLEKSGGKPTGDKFLTSVVGDQEAKRVAV